jgi:hypothetical protein
MLLFGCFYWSMVNHSAGRHRCFCSGGCNADDVGGPAFLYYVGKEIRPALGYITGWCLGLGYVLNPRICTIWCSRVVMNFVPGIPWQHLLRS